MKGHKAHHHSKHRAEGGGVDEAAEDLRTKPEPRTNAKKIDEEAEAMHAKRGGRAARKRGGHVHHEHGKHLAHAKHLGHVEGHHAEHHAGRKARKAGGSVESNPFTSANKGISPNKHHVEKETMGRD